MNFKLALLMGAVVLLVLIAGCVSPTPGAGTSTGSSTVSYLSDGTEDWHRLKYSPSYTNYYSNNQPMQVWYYSDGNSLSDSFIIFYYDDGTTRSAYYYGEDGEIYWYRKWDSGGTLTDYVLYDTDHQGHIIIGDSSASPTADYEVVMPAMNQPS